MGNGSRIIDTRKRADQVRAQIVEMVHAGSLKPGDELPTELQLMEMFGVGRSSVRDAIQALIGLGFVEMRPGHGAYVREVSAADIIRLTADIFSLSHEDALQLAEARSIIEVTAARLAAERGTSDDLAAMRDAIVRTREMADPADSQVVIEADIDFHRAIVVATHN